VFSNPDTGCPISQGANASGFFGDPIRNPILGLDGQIGAFTLRGLPLWNLDLGIGKKIRVTERASGSLYFDFTNVLNHMQRADPCYNSFDTTTWGVLGCGGNVQANAARRLQVGFQINF